MTIGTNMPFKLKFQALTRSAGKEELQGDPKGMPDNREPPADFSLLLKAVTTKQKVDIKQTGSDEEITEPEDHRSTDAENLTSTGQGLFMQPIITLEQMLDRRQHDEESFLTTAKIGALTAEIIPVPASGEAGPPVDIDDIRQEVEAAVPQEEKQQLLKAEERTDRPSGSLAVLPASGQPVLETQTQTRVPATKHEADARVSTAAVIDAKLETTDSEPVAETPLREAVTLADRGPPLSAAASLSQTTPKPSTGNIAIVVTSASHPAITDIQVVSDRTVGAARTLVIQLQPVELGTVTARLRLTSDGMHIQIDAATTAMAEHLSNDREALGKALHRAGVTEDVSSVTISIVDRSATGSGAHQAGQHNPGGQDQQMGARGNNQGQSGSQNTPRDRSAGQHFFGEATPDDQVEKLAKADIQGRSSRGLVV